MHAVVLVAGGHDPNLAVPLFTHMLGEGWTVHAYASQDDVPDDVAATADVVLAALAPTGAPLLARAPKLRLIQVPGHGYDHVDVEAARAAGVPVATVASSGAEAHTVAEWTILMAGALSRRMVAGHTALARGEFANMALMQSGIFELAGKTFGIVGLGRIGREVAVRARAFDMTVVYHDALRPPAEVERELGVEYLDLDVLLAEAHFVSLHVPSMPQTRGMIGARELDLMRHEAILINTCRGDVVDHDALVAALRAKRIRGAALDVFEPEPPPPDDPLLALDDVLLSPHMAGVTAESLLRILQAACDNCVRLARGEEPHDVVGEGGAH